MASCMIIAWHSAMAVTAQRGVVFLASLSLTATMTSFSH